MRLRRRPKQSGKRALVHIGTTKTGSTAIQESLARAAQDNRLAGISFPMLVGHHHKVHPHHNFFRVLYRPVEELTRTHKAAYTGPTGAADRARDVAAFRDGLADAATGNDRFVFSGEFMMDFSPAEIDDFRREMAGVGITDITPVMYVRNPVSRYLSSVQQAIKASSVVPDPNTYGDTTLRYLNRWREAFPELIVRPFDRGSFDDGDVVADFLGVVSDHFETDLRSRGIESATSNESISAEGMVIVQRYRSTFHAGREDVFMPDSSRLIRLLMQSKELIEQTTPRLNAATERIVATRHAGFCAELWERYGIDYRTPAESEEMSGTAALPEGTSLTVADILDSYDPTIIQELMFWLLNRSFARIEKLTAAAKSQG